MTATIVSLRYPKLCYLFAETRSLTLCAQRLPADMPKTYSDQELDEQYVWVSGGLFTAHRWEKVGAPKISGAPVSKVTSYQGEAFENGLFSQIFSGISGRSAPAKSLREILPASHPQSAQNQKNASPRM